MDDSAKMTPMMSQYRRIRSQLPADTILFFRLGDFYEMFYDDAKVASQILDLALTKRQKMPMCGVPYHAADQYIARLVRAGRKVAVCDQLEDPAKAKGIVRRDVTGVVTPGTATVDGVLDSKRNNFLAGISSHGGSFGLALLDLSTGTFRVEEAASAEAVCENVARYAPSECILPQEEPWAGEIRPLLRPDSGLLVTACEDWTFEYDAAYDLLVRHFATQSLEGFGCEGSRVLVGAAGAVLHYVKENLRRNVSHVRSLRVGNPGGFLVLDEATCANLDLVSVRGRAGAQESGLSLLKVLDCTATAMGGRLVREWILRPLAEAGAIRARHDAVEEMHRDRGLLHGLRDAMAAVHDIERLIARLAGGSGNARDLRALAQSLSGLPAVKALLGPRRAGLLRSLDAGITPLPELVELIERSVVDEPPVSVREGGMIRPGYRPDLDELRSAAASGRNWLADFQTRERERTGIKTLKVRFNRVFGYYIEISKGQVANAPPEYERKQTLVNGERFVTPEIKEYERKILGSQDRAMALEYDIFCELRDEAVRRIGEIQASAAAIAEADVLASFAHRALLSGYVRPGITESETIRVKDGRHPVVEQTLEAGRFVPNDLLVDCSGNQILMITGPNMAGKSTYIRQAALLVIMAQAGSFVPAVEASMGVVDRVFTRVGASDDIARGRSTFMVEMQETANILNNATPRSLVVLDEIGRGTSTFDGISIAWAVAEFLHNNPRVKAKTLFATHYHELTDMALTMPGIRNYNVLVKEKKDGIVFLRKIAPGAADKSYGIHVARLAGLPPEVIDRAREILLNLEEGEFSEPGKPKIAQYRARKERFDRWQMTLFEEKQPPR